jgi:hypothetical protein
MSGLVGDLLDARTVPASLGDQPDRGTWPSRSKPGWTADRLDRSPPNYLAVTSQQN